MSGGRRRAGVCVVAILGALAAACGAELRQRGFRQEAVESHRHGEWAAAVRFADEALRQGRPTPAVDAELATIKADALGRLGFPGERELLLRYVAALYPETRYGAAARAALALRSSSVRVGPGERSGAILPAVVVLERPWLMEPVSVFYPLEASLVGLEGSALLVLEVDASGRVLSHRVIEASDPAFARAADAAANDFAVEPSALGATTWPVTKPVRLNFRLRGAEAAASTG